MHDRPRTNSDADPDELTEHLHRRFPDNPLLPAGGGQTNYQHITFGVP